MVPELRPSDIGFHSGAVICQEGKAKELRRTRTPRAVDLLSTLPVEVISHIFCHACRPIHGNPEWRRECYPLLLGQICRQYRQYAWATSELWATIVIRISRRHLAAQTELLEEWLERTRGRSIDIYFKNWSLWRQARYLSWPSSNPSAVPMINLLAKSSRQWRCIDFHIPFFWYPIFTSSKISDPSPDNDQPTQSVALKKPLDLPLLVSASFHYEDHGIVATDDEVDLDLTLAPSLHTLSLSLFQMSPALLKRITCKDKVTMMVLQRTTGPYMDLNDLLPHFPNLQEAAFHSAWFIMQNPPPDITHRKLRKLEVDAYFGWRDLKVLFLVIFPRLESLSVQVPSTIRYGELLKGFIAHNSESHLTSLSLSCKITREHELIDVLSALGSLRELYIQDTSVGGTPGFGFSYLFFDALHPDEPDTMTSLEVLSYKGNLLVQSIAFLTPVIIRSRMRGEIHKNLEKLPVLRKVRIQADQLLDSDESRIADYPDPPYVCEVRTMMERGILELLTMDGGQWE